MLKNCRVAIIGMLSSSIILVAVEKVFQGGLLSGRVNKILAWGKFFLILVLILRVFFMLSFTCIKRLGGF